MTNKKASQQNEKLSHGYYRNLIVYLCSNYVAFNCNGGYMSRNTLTLVQEVYFDLCDLLDNNELDDRVNGFYEFDSIRDFIMEQKQKMALIERDLDLNDDCPKFEPAKEEI
jgi:hypothetical protein